MKEAEKIIKKVYIALGSNILPEVNIPLALEKLSDVFGKLVAQSPIWQTPAVGSDGPDFLNSVILIITELSADELKKDILLPIEDKMGRVRTTDKNAARTIDLDILIYDDKLFEKELWTQVHLAVPLAEIYPDYIHPEQNKTIFQIAKVLMKKSKIIIYKK